jgi:hypothetical protein
MRYLAVLAALVGALPDDAEASYAFYVGNKLTADGSVLVGGTGEEVSSHWLAIVPRQRHKHGATITVGVTAEAAIPGRLSTIPQAPLTYRYITMRYSDYKGFPAPLTNGGLNEHQVAIRDVWSPSRRELVAMTPRPQRGPSYSDLARVALQRARTARQAAALIGRLIEQYGYSSYGGNSHLIADPNEGWVLIAFAGGQRLWVAERLGPRDIRVSYPGYIGEIPQGYRRHRDYMGSKNLISFAVERGWFKPAPGRKLDVYKVYGLGKGTARSPGLKLVDPRRLEQELRRKAPRITVRDLMAAVRDPRIADEEAGYGQVAHLRRGVPGELAMLWVAPTGSVTSPFVPYRIGVQEVLAEYRQHRYLTKGAATHFLSPDFQSQEGTRFAGRLFKRLLYHTCAHPKRFLPEVTGALEAFERRALAEQPTVEQTAVVLRRGGRADLARRYLTDYSRRKAAEALELGEALLGSIEARTRLIYGIRRPRGVEINARSGPTPHCHVGADPDKPRSSKHRSTAAGGLRR